MKIVQRCILALVFIFLLLNVVQVDSVLPTQFNVTTSVVNESLNRVWDDISPAFYYWLATTPLLEISEVVITGQNSVGSTLTIEAKVKNKSPRVTTIEEVKVVFDDFTPVTSEGSPITISKIKENYKSEVQIEQGNNITLLVGNDFVGYYPLVIDTDLINKSRGTPVDILGILTGILVIIVIRRKIQEM